MDFQDICLHCFSSRGGFDVCPYCGHIAGTPNQPAFLLQPGTRLWGRYVIGTVLGVGGFGVTYRAWDTRLAALVAIKEFFPQNLVSRIPGESKVRPFSGENFESYALQLSRFLEEAKNLAKFTGDTHIVNVFDFFEDNGSAYIVMEYLDGETLKEHLVSRGGALPPEEAAQVMEGLLLALSSIHKKGVIHRDISPDNLFILRSGQVKVLDFGAARFAVREDWTQSVVVKKGYAPPEQYRSNMRQSERTDLYAAGATWYKMLTGQTPEESIERWEKDTLSRPSQIGAQVDTNVDKAIMKAMALRPELRFQSAELMLAAVRGQTGFDFPEEELKKRRRIRGISIAFAFVAVLTVLGIAGWQISSAPPGTVGPTLADMNISPDTVSILVSDYDNKYGLYQKLADAFHEQYPDYTVEVIARSYEDVDANPPDFTKEGAPTIFAPYQGNGRECLTDLSPLIAGLDRKEYYLLDRYEEDYDEPTAIPIAFTCTLAYASPGKAKSAGVSLPDRFTSAESVLDAYAPMPEAMDMRLGDFVSLMRWYKPEIYAGKQYRPELWEALMRRYLDYEEKSREDGNSYSKSYLIIEDFYLSSMRYTMERWPGDCIAIPVEKNGKLSGNFGRDFGVNRYASENQQRVAMLFLHFLLSERGQTMIHVQEDNSLPLNRKAMATFLNTYPIMKPLEPKFSTIDFDYGSLPSGLFNALQDIDYNNGAFVPDDIMKLFMEYDPEQAE